MFRYYDTRKMSAYPAQQCVRYFGIPFDNHESQTCIYAKTLVYYKNRFTVAALPQRLAKMLQ